MVDLHTHILPYLDDGAEDLEITIEMLRSMIDSGVHHVVATPHFNPSSDDLDTFLNNRRQSLDLVLNIVSELSLNIHVYSGAEIMLSSDIIQMDLSPFTIANSDYVLIELSTQYDDPNLESLLREVLNKGFIPVIAHIERYSYLVNNSQRIVNLIQQGCLMQVNVTGITSNRYPHVKAMIKKNLIHLVGSDAHNMRSRKPNLNGEDIPKEYLRNNNLIIRNQDINVLQAKTLTKILNKYF